MSWWPTVWLLLAAFMFVGTLWNVITVSFRQSVIPDHLLGRVNSVYRFFGWGMMPIGAALGLGGIVAIALARSGAHSISPVPEMASRSRGVSSCTSDNPKQSFSNRSSRSASTCTSA